MKEKKYAENNTYKSQYAGNRNLRCSKGIYREVFHPVSSEARDELNKKVLAAYEQKLTEEQSQEQDETETLSEDESQAPVTQTM